MNIGDCNVFIHCTRYIRVDKFIYNEQQRKFPEYLNLLFVYNNSNVIMFLAFYRITPFTF